MKVLKCIILMSVFSLKRKQLAIGERHFSERHTDENIAAVFEQMLDTYGIEASNAGYQVTDSAKTCFARFIFQYVKAG